MTNPMRSAILGSFVIALVALTSYAQDATPSPSVSPSPRPDRRSEVNLACMQSAIGKRDDAITAALDKYHSTVRKALQTRKDALKNAWAIQNPKERREAIKAAWNGWKDTMRMTTKELRKARNEAWKTYQADRRACRGNSSDERGTDSRIEGSINF